MTDSKKQTVNKKNIYIYIHRMHSVVQVMFTQKKFT